MQEAAPASGQFIIGTMHAPVICSPSPSHPISSKVDDAFLKFRSVWAYLGKSLATTRALLNAAARSICTHLDTKITKVVVSLRLFSIGNSISELYVAHNGAKTLIKGCRLRDVEGVALATLATTAALSEAFDSSSSFINAVLITSSAAPIDVLMTISPPVTMAGLAMAGIIRGYQIGHGIHLQQEIERDLLSTDTPEAMAQALRQFLSEKLGTTSQNLDAILAKLQHLKDASPEALEKEKTAALQRLHEIKKSAMLRKYHPFVHSDLERLLTLLTAKPALDAHDVQEVMRVLKHIMSISKKKIAVDVISIISNAFICLALLIAFAGMPPALPFLIFASGFILKIASQIYQQRSMTSLQPTTNL